jgi:hypothetical protein
MKALTSDRSNYRPFWRSDQSKLASDVNAVIPGSLPERRDELLNAITFKL